MKSFCLIIVKYHPKQKYIILFQETLFQGRIYFRKADI